MMLLKHGPSQNTQLHTHEGSQQSATIHSHYQVSKTCHTIIVINKPVIVELTDTLELVPQCHLVGRSGQLLNTATH